MNIKQVNSAIMSGSWTNSELSSMIEAINFNRTQLRKQIRRSLSVGDSVSFTSSKTRQNVTGIVVKIAIKYVTIKTVNGLWKVPANMLTIIDDIVV